MEKQIIKLGDKDKAEYIEFSLGPNQTEVTKTVKHIAFTT